MSYTVDLDLLRKKLARAKRQKEAPAPCSRLRQKEIEITEEVRYLVKNVFDPLCRGEKVHTGDLDFSRFDRQDIWKLNDFYQEHCFAYDCDWRRLKTLFDACCAASAETRITRKNGYV